MWSATASGHPRQTGVSRLGSRLQHWPKTRHRIRRVDARNRASEMRHQTNPLSPEGAAPILGCRRARQRSGRIRLVSKRLRFTYLRFRTRACSFSLQVSGRTSETNPSAISLLKARSFSKRLRPCRSAAVRNGTFEDSISSSSCRWRRPSPLGMTPHRHSDAKQAPDQYRRVL